MKLHSPVASTNVIWLRRNACTVAVAERFEPSMSVHDPFRLAGRTGREDDECRSFAVRVERGRRHDSDLRLLGRSIRADPPGFTTNRGT